MNSLLFGNLTSCTTSGCKALMTWANFVSCRVIARVKNCASTWANQRAGSPGQYGGSLSPKAVTAGPVLPGAVGAAAESESGISVDGDVVIIMHTKEISLVEEQQKIWGHQCRNKCCG